LLLLGVMAMLVLALAGYLGPTQSNVSASSEGYRLTVTYPKVTRSGQSSEWSVEVKKNGGFDNGEKVTLTADADYAGLFDSVQPSPQASSSTSDGSRLLWQFDTPSNGDTMKISLAGRIRTIDMRGRSGKSEVLDPRGRTLVSVSYKTTMVP
jgi:hypothetical protein